MRTSSRRKAAAPAITSGLDSDSSETSSRKRKRGSEKRAEAEGSAAEQQKYDKRAKLLGSAVAGDKLWLRIDEQPTDTFYKDEGGKGNVLRAVVNLYQGNARARPPCNVAMKFSLFFESGVRVEDSDQDILK